MAAHGIGKRWLTTALAAGGLFMAGVLGGGAQDATPAAAAPHPAHIHLGACDSLDPNPTYPLTDVAATGAASESAAIPVEQSVTTVDATLADLASGGYAINIHQSAEEIGTYIACGSLAGEAQGDALVVGLGELNDSGYAGIAVLTANGEQSDVAIYLAQNLYGGEGGEMASTADSGEADMAAMDGAAVSIKDLLYNPATIEIPVGGTVTWTNNDTVPHTVTAQDRALLQSGTIDAGGTFSQTFTAPGSIDYFCEFHANMKGTVVVQ